MLKSFKKLSRLLFKNTLILFYGTSFALRPIRLIRNIINIRKKTPVTRLEHVLIKAFYRHVDDDKTETNGTVLAGNSTVEIKQGHQHKDEMYQ